MFHEVTSAKTLYKQPPTPTPTPPTARDTLWADAKPFHFISRENIFTQKHRRVICSGSSLPPLKGGVASGPPTPPSPPFWKRFPSNSLFGDGSNRTFSIRYWIKCGKCVRLTMTESKTCEYFSSGLTLEGPR